MNSYQYFFIKSFCGGSRGVVFSKRIPLAAGGTEIKGQAKKSIWQCYLNPGNVTDLDFHLFHRGLEFQYMPAFAFIF